jgi:hypothetical protein
MAELYYTTREKADAYDSVIDVFRELFKELKDFRKEEAGGDTQRREGQTHKSSSGRRYQMHGRGELREVSRISRR